MKKGWQAIARKVARSLGESRRMINGGKQLSCGREGRGHDAHLCAQLRVHPAGDVVSWRAAQKGKGQKTGPVQASTTFGWRTAVGGPWEMNPDRIASDQPGRKPGVEPWARVAARGRTVCGRCGDPMTSVDVTPSRSCTSAGLQRRSLSPGSESLRFHL